jgi:hypothetical protein
VEAPHGAGLMSVFRFRFLVVAFCFLPMACSVIIPDYNAKRTIDRTDPPPIRITTNVIGAACADQQAGETKFKEVYFWVHLLRPEKVRFSTNTTVTVVKLDNVATFNFKAGVGKHKVTISTANFGPFSRGFGIYDCQ